MPPTPKPKPPADPFRGLDHLPKMERVYEALQRCLADLGFPPGCRVRCSAWYPDGTRITHKLVTRPPIPLPPEPPPAAKPK